MKTKEQIKEMIERCKKLRQVIPNYSTFGEDNWTGLDKQREILTKCLDMKGAKIESAARHHLDALEELEQEWSEDDVISVYDWVLEKIEDDLVSEDDIENFSKDKKEG